MGRLGLDGLPPSHSGLHLAPLAFERLRLESVHQKSSGVILSRTRYDEKKTKVW